jgi:hypothetical protein
MKFLLVLVAVVALALVAFADTAQAHGPRFNAGFNSGFNHGFNANARFNGFGAQANFRAVPVPVAPATPFFQQTTRGPFGRVRSQTTFGGF